MGGWFPEPFLSCLYVRVETVGVAVQNDIDASTACRGNYGVLVTEIDTHDARHVWFMFCYVRGEGSDRKGSLIGTLRKTKNNESPPPWRCEKTSSVRYRHDFHVD
jgi:hypothetical protein